MNNLCPKSAVASSSQSVPDSLSDPRPNPLPFPALKPYNQSHMQPALSARISDGFMAAIWLGGEKPHQGVSSRNQAWHPAPNVCNSTTALGLQAGCAGNRVRSFCSGEQYDSDLALYYLRARYYNPATGRFLSRDPEDGKPNDPQSLHKYLYASGDPVNRIDPSGRGDLIEVSLDDWSARQNVVLAERALAKRAAYELCVEAFLLNYEALGIGTVGTGGMGLLLGAQARCAALYL